MNKAELAELLEGEVWQTIEADLKNEWEEAKELLCGLKFSDPSSNLEAVKYQAKIEAISQIFDKVSALKEDSE